MRDNYGNQVPTMEMILDHLVTQKNCGSKRPIVIPYQQLIYTLLHLLHGNDMGSFSYTAKLYIVVLKKQKRQKQTT